MESRMTVHEDGTKAWFNENGQLHRENGPAIIWSHGIQKWYKNGKLHREDGPAIIRRNGKMEWWANNIWYPSFKIWADKLNLGQRARLELVMKWNPN